MIFQAEAKRVKKACKNVIGRKNGQHLRKNLRWNTFQFDTSKFVDVSCLGTLDMLYGILCINIRFVNVWYCISTIRMVCMVPILTLGMLMYGKH